MTQLIDPEKYTTIIDKLRRFFLYKDFREVHTQNRLSILAACEDPFNVATYEYAGEVWPLPQTGQMWLEYELLTNPSVPGYFCISTSYRQEPNAIPGRHDIIFPMFEFEMQGTERDLEILLQDLCTFLGFGPLTSKTYAEWQKVCALEEHEEITAHHENAIGDFFGPSMITSFPEITSPFWNMRRNKDGTSMKIDVILGGMETIGSAERSSNVKQMRDTFHTISDGAYSELLFKLFTKERVEKELEEFLQHNFISRVGGGIGITRLISAFDDLKK